MKIWLINHYANSPLESGGTRHFSLAAELRKRGHEVTIVASSIHHGSRLSSRLRDDEQRRLDTVHGVPFLWVRTPQYSGNGPARLWNMIAFSHRLWSGRALRDLSKPDIIIGSSPHLFAAWAAQRLAARLRVPFLLEVRDLWPQSLVELGNMTEGHPLIWMLEQIERYLYKKSDRIISLLPRAREHMVQKGAKADKILWLPNGVDLQLVPAPGPYPEESTEIPFTIMFAGAHGVANGLDQILDAAAILLNRGLGNRIRFRLVGDGPEKARLQERASKEGLSNVHFEGSVPKSQIYEVMSEAHAFVMVLKESPVFQWGVSPNKLFDYLACARPVIFAVNSPYNPVEVAQAGVTVNQLSPEALVEAAIQLVNKPKGDRVAMGERGRAYVEENHSFAKLAERLEELFQTM